MRDRSPGWLLLSIVVHTMALSTLWGARRPSTRVAKQRPVQFEIVLGSQPLRRAPTKPPSQPPPPQPAKKTPTQAISKLLKVPPRAPPPHLPPVPRRRAPSRSPPPDHSASDAEPSATAEPPRKAAAAPTDVDAAELPEGKAAAALEIAPSERPPVMAHPSTMLPLAPPLDLSPRGAALTMMEPESLESAQLALAVKAQASTASAQSSESRTDAAEATLEAALMRDVRKPVRFEEEPVLRKKNGGYSYEGRGFNATIDRHGNLTMRDRFARAKFKWERGGGPIFQFRFGIYEWLDKKRGNDPFRTERRWFLERTRELREQLAARGPGSARLAPGAAPSAGSGHAGGTPKGE